VVTPDFLREHKLSAEELKKLQYYTDGPIIFSRVMTSAGQQIAGGRLIAVSGRSYEIVVIERGTPGIATDVQMGPSSEWGMRSISISFEPHCTMIYPWSEVSNQSLYPNEKSYCGLTFMSGVPHEAKEAARSQGIDADESDYHPPRLLVDFSPAKATVKTRVVPGRTLDK
jgi:hypothetical protein